MTKNEDFALGFYICDVPEDKSFNEILEMVEDCSVWQPFEDYPHNSVIGFILNMKHSLDDAYPEGREQLSTGY